MHAHFCSVRFALLPIGFCCIHLVSTPMQTKHRISLMLWSNALLVTHSPDWFAECFRCEEKQLRLRNWPVVLVMTSTQTPIALATGEQLVIIVDESTNQASAGCFAFNRHRSSNQAVAVDNGNVCVCATQLSVVCLPSLNIESVTSTLCSLPGVDTSLATVTVRCV